LVLLKRSVNQFTMQGMINIYITCLVVYASLFLRVTFGATDRF
jgi:hypothetical protein